MWGWERLESLELSAEKTDVKTEQWLTFSKNQLWYQPQFPCYTYSEKKLTHKVLCEFHYTENNLTSAEGLRILNSLWKEGVKSLALP